MYSLVIKGGKIIDGTGGSAYLGDIAVKDGKIVKISDEIIDSSEHVIHANGKVVSPGFIDSHAHNDGYIFLDTSNIYKLAQGVTTEISGNCGEGLTPISGKYYDEIFEYYRTYYVTDALRTYTSMEKYFDEVKKLRLGNNLGFLCAHGTLRMSAMGFSKDKPSPEEMANMKKMLAESMEAGALGMSSGLVYSPGCFSDTEELVELGKVVSEYGGVYTSHIRSEGYALLDAVNEAIEVARQANVTTVISHMKALGKKYWGMTADMTRMIEEARSEGLKVFGDQYPYTSSCTVLHWVIPPEYTEGGLPKMCERLSDSNERKKIKGMYNNEFGQWDNLMENIGPAGIHILKADETPGAVGKTLREYAELIGNDPYDTLFDVIVANKADVIAAFDCMCEDDICHIMKKDYCMVGSDGIAVKPNEQSHPRITGTFPRVLGKYVREERIISLESAVRKMTSLPASIFGIAGKGVLREGFDADICVFDENLIIDRSTIDNFHVKPDGIECVIVNGKIAFTEKQYTGAASGVLVTK